MKTLHAAYKAGVRKALEDHVNKQLASTTPATNEEAPAFPNSQSGYQKTAGGGYERVEKVVNHSDTVTKEPQNKLRQKDSGTQAPLVNNPVFGMGSASAGE